MHSVGPLEIVDDLGRTQAEQRELNHSRDEGESVLSVRGIGALRLSAPMTTGAIVARDLDLVDLGVRGGKIRDGASSDLEGLAEAGAAVGASIERELQGWGVRHRTLPSMARMSGLSPGRVRIAADRSAIEDMTGGDTARLRRPVGAGEHRGTGLVAPEFLLESTILLQELAMLALDLLRPLEPFSELLQLRRVDGDRLLILIGSEQSQ